MEFTHAQYLKDKKEILGDTAFVEEYIQIEEESAGKLVWLADVDNGFNADIEHLDIAMKTSVPMRSNRGNLTSGALAVATAVDNADGANVWNNPTNVYSLDGNLADSHLDAAERSTNYLKCTNFSFTIPTTATVTDVIATVQGYAADTGNLSLAGKIVKGGTIGGTSMPCGALTTITPTSDTTPDYCGTAADDGATGPGVVIVWANPTNAQGTADAAVATAHRTNPPGTWNNYSNYLLCTNFGIAVPANNIITGIKVEVLGNVQNGSAGLTGMDVNLIIGGVMSTTYKKFEEWDDPTSALSWKTYIMPIPPRTLGAADVNASNFGVALKCIFMIDNEPFTVDAVRITATYAPYTSFPAVSFGSGLWGNTLAPTDVNASTFGVALQAQNSAGDNQIYVDKVSLEVKYTLFAPSTFNTSIRINPQGLGWEEIHSFEDSYTVGNTTQTFTHQAQKVIPAADLVNAKAPFKLGVFLEVPGDIDYKTVSADGTYAMIYGDSE